MKTNYQLQIPLMLEAIERDTEQLGYSMGSDRACGSLLRTLAATKPGGQFLELGTGTGISAVWLLAGMDEKARLITVDNDRDAAAIAHRHLGSDGRAEFRVEDAGNTLDGVVGREFDLIFADTWIGKFERLDDTLALLAKGGLYIVDDLLPQPNWPAGHGARVSEVVEALAQKEQLMLTWLSWSTGIMIGSRI